MGISAGALPFGSQSRMRPRFRRALAQAALAAVGSSAIRLSVASGVSPAMASKLARAWSSSRFRRRRILNIGEFRKQLLQTDGRIDNHRLHFSHMLEMRIEVDRVEDFEGLLINFIAAPCRPAEHLLIENTAIDPAQEYQIFNT